MSINLFLVVVAVTARLYSFDAIAVAVNRPPAIIKAWWWRKATPDDGDVLILAALAQIPVETAFGLAAEWRLQCEPNAGSAQVAGGRLRVLGTIQSVVARFIEIYCKPTDTPLPRNRLRVPTIKKVPRNG